MLKIGEVFVSLVYWKMTAIKSLAPLFSFDIMPVKFIGLESENQ